MILNSKKFVTNSNEGFSVLVWAFLAESAGNMTATGFTMHNPDVAGNSWSKLGSGPASEGTKWEKEYPFVFSDESGYESFQKPGKAEGGSLKTGPTLVEMVATRLAYSQIAFAAISIAEFG